MAQQNRDAVDRLQRGLIIALFAIVGILAIVLTLRLLRTGTELLGPLSTESAPAASGTGSGGGDVTTLLAAARTAMAQSRLVAPAGNNAYENYLAVLEQQPNNVSAREALNDLYGIAVSSAEQAIAASDFTDAARLADLLSRSNPNSFTVVNLRQRIERGLEAQEAANVAQQQPASATSVPAARPVAAPPESAAEPASDLASVTSPSTPANTPAETAGGDANVASRSRTTAAPPSNPVTTTTTSASLARSPTSTVREARLLSRVDPQYPREAMRSRQQGWVEVEFTIGRDGTVSDVAVVASRPGRVFDRAAQQAISEWRFEPRLENGQPVASRLRQRFDFRLD